MKKLLIIIVLLSLLFCQSYAQTKLNVVATIPDLAALVSEVGGEYVAAQSISKGTQDPHFLEAKPSYMTRINRADLIVSVGLELEIGWLPTVLYGARNPKVIPGNRGYLELGSLIDPIEVSTLKITRAAGDVHPLGNPHFNLDPIRMGHAAIKIAERLGELDPEHAAYYDGNARNLQRRLEEKTKLWKKRIEVTGIKKVITFHKTLDYFFDRFGIINPINLEPKPGIPPTAQHVMKVIDIAKKQDIKLVMIENFYEISFADRLKHEVPGLRIVLTPVEVGGEPAVETPDDLYEKLVSAIEGK